MRLLHTKIILPILLFLLMIDLASSQVELPEPTKARKIIRTAPVPESPNTWLRFFDLAKNSPAFAGMYGHHVVSANAGIERNPFEMGSIASLSYQHGIKSSGSGYRFTGRNQYGPGNSWWHGMQAGYGHTIRLQRNKNSYISAGINASTFNTAFETIFGQVEVEVHRLPQINAGLLFHSGRFFTGITLENINGTYHSFQMQGESIFFDSQTRTIIYGAYRTSYGVTGTIQVNPLGRFMEFNQFKSGNVVEFGLFVPVRKVIVAGVEYGDSGFGRSVGCQVSYIGQQRLRGGIGYDIQSTGNFWVNESLNAHISVVLGKL